MLPSNLFDIHLKRFDELIAEGEEMYKGIKVEPGEYCEDRFGTLKQLRETYSLDNYDFKKWQINYKLLLDQVIPPTNSQRTLIEEPSYAYDLKTNLKDHLSALKAVRESYQKGLLTCSQSTLGSLSLEAEGSSYEQIIAFIWDDFRRTEEHDLLSTGLKDMKGIFDVVIVSRPGLMLENLGNSEVE